MEKKYMERLIGKYCKIVTKEPGEKRASVVTGTLEDVDYQDGFILVDSEQGLGCLRISTIVAIKPGNKHKKASQNEEKNIKNNNLAMVGIGTLIVFIATILIAAVAAGVLISTSEMLQQRAKTVGIQTVREVSAGVNIESIIGYTDENRTRIEYLAITIRPRAGSENIDLSLCTLTVLREELTVLTLNESLITMVNTDGKSVFSTPIEGKNYSMLQDLKSTEFGLIAIHDPDDSLRRTSGMNTGDRAFIMINLSSILSSDANSTTGLLPRETISGAFTPELGSGASYDVRAPEVYAHRIISLI
jgi:archaeal flagellin FlaB